MMTKDEVIEKLLEETFPEQKLNDPFDLWADDTDFPFDPFDEVLGG